MEIKLGEYQTRKDIFNYHSCRSFNGGKMDELDIISKHKDSHKLPDKRFNCHPCRNNACNRMAGDNPYCDVCQPYEDRIKNLIVDNKTLLMVIEKATMNLEYAAFNLTSLKKTENLPVGIVESASSEETLLIELRDLKTFLKNYKETTCI